MNTPAKEWIVLVVDDTADDACLLQLAAERVCSAIHFESVLDGDSALRKLNADLRAGFRLPDLVLVNSILPDCNGLSVWKRMQAHPRLWHLPVLILSNQAHPVSDSHHSSGGVRFVPRPTNMNEFRCLVRIVSEMLGARAPFWAPPTESDAPAVLENSIGG